jgi:hypothetical protein
MNLDLANLRTKIDSNDPFMSGGHQILKIRLFPKKIPDWINDLEKIRQLLLRSFPKLAIDSNQRKAASRWARIINLYWVMGYTRMQVVDEINDQTGENTETFDSINSTIRSIKRVSEGLRADGTGLKSNKRGGRRVKHARSQ